MSFDPLLAYNDLPALSGASFVTPEIYPKLVEARAALARLDTAAKYSPFAQALVDSIPRVEAEASSAIENIVTTQDELFTSNLAEELAEDSRAIYFVGRYFRAMEMARATLSTRPISIELTRRICTQIEGYAVVPREYPGTVLQDNAGKTVYTPPDDPRVIDSLLRDWEGFINDERVDPLIRMAVGHYQFESIHPFPNGNGRTGRIINLLILESAQLLHKPVLHLSREIKDNSAQYYALLRHTTASGEFEPWILYILDRVIAASELGLLQLDMLADYMAELRNISHPAFRNGIPASFLERVAASPYTKTTTVMEVTGASRPTATKWLEALVSLGYLQAATFNRTKYFLSTRVLRILNP